ncbi:hypothetical protein [Piscinibacter gummiphilus]|uniref:hypothetical protein n=1 Tax=Piscinibacter gummiphilus TaxID=946333 RepID=UPI0012F5091C|nr:hypothetical protein [Piscinibacter gummiphilus]GLS97881.1 hypothetical protein GCM10007918_51730 [Piscinibacter gummiphilus]
MKQLLDALNSRCGWDCVIKSYDGWRLSLSSGTSVEYATPVAAFIGVSYVSLPFEFSHPKFRIASLVEREKIEKVVPVDPEDAVLAIEAETMASFDRQVFFLVASSVEVEAVLAAPP